MNSKYRYLVPNGVTFTSLTCGIVSILLSTTGSFFAAGVLILASYVLDLFDGYLARRLSASSEFGLQLDSLVDMVSLGIAPAVLVFVHARAEGLIAWWVWPVVVLAAMAGAFRLARFNLLPPKETGNTDSVGLTISTGGATMALAVLSDLSISRDLLPEWSLALQTFLVSLLMISRIPFPSFFWVFSGRRGLIVTGLIIVSTFFIPFFHDWFLWNLVYLVVSLGRAAYKHVRVPATSRH